MMSCDRDILHDDEDDDPSEPRKNPSRPLKCDQFPPTDMNYHRPKIRRGS